MPDPVTAIIGGAATLGATATGSYFQGRAADKAVSSQNEALARSEALTAPWREAGQRALNVLEPKVMAGPGEFIPEEQPGYRFGYKEFVEKPTLANASARGRLGSGAMQKALSRYASDYATTKYDNFLNNWLKTLAPLQSLAQVGVTTATQAGQNALATGGANANVFYNEGQNQGNLWGNAIASAGQDILDYQIGKKIGVW